jgi:ATP-binding cassette subfamily B multidrug efflux pump
MSDQAQEVLSGVRVVKAFVKEAYFLRRFADANDTYQRRNMRLVRIWGLFFPLVSFLSGLTLFMLLWVGGRSLLSGELTAGDFVAT